MWLSLLGRHRGDSKSSLQGRRWRLRHTAASQPGCGRPAAPFLYNKTSLAPHWLLITSVSIAPLFPPSYAPIELGADDIRKSRRRCPTLAVARGFLVGGWSVRTHVSRPPPPPTSPPPPTVLRYSMDVMMLKDEFKFGSLQVHLWVLVSSKWRWHRWWEKKCSENVKC